MGSEMCIRDRNILKFEPVDRFDLVWSAGLFDYFSDKLFVKTLQRIRRWLKPEGEVIIGNFGPHNPSRGAMEFGDWFLKYRSPDQLMELATKAGFDDFEAAVEREELGINLFLNLRKQGE